METEVVSIPGKFMNNETGEVGNLFCVVRPVGLQPHFLFFEDTKNPTMCEVHMNCADFISVD